MLHLENISYAYPNQKETLKNISLKSNKPEIIAVIGESGSGKSTLLKLIYGLLQPAEGEIHWKTKKLYGPDFNLIPGEKFIKFVGQDFNLNRPLNVKENILTHLRLVEKINKEEQVNALLKLVGLENYKHTKVSTLSFGQQQRVALAKELAKQPELLLLDEPFSNIDNFRKNSIRRKLFSFLKSKKITTIISTHDKEDILSFSDRCIVLKDGRIIADENTQKLYSIPKTEYIASFFNDVNVLECSLFDLQDFAKDSILIYPDEIEIVKASKFRAKVEDIYFKGNRKLYSMALNGQTVLIESSQNFLENDSVYIALSHEFRSNLQNRIVLKE